MPTPQQVAGCLAVAAHAGNQEDAAALDSLIQDQGIRWIFVKNSTLEDAKRSIDRWRTCAPEGVAVLTDGEWGTGQRFLDGESFPKAEELGRTASQNTQGIYQLIGQGLRDLGVDLNLAPVSDVHIADDLVGARRSFGSDPQQVAEHTVAAVMGLHDAQVGACLKHFPGHGCSVAVSEGRMDPITLERWREVYAPPIRSAIAKANPELVMVGNLTMPGLDDTGTPALFSRKMIQNLLREECEYQGVVISDNLATAPVQRRWELPDAVVEALKAGNDLCLLSDWSISRAQLYRDSIPKIIERVGLALEQGEISLEQWNQSAARRQALMSQFQKARAVIQDSAAQEEVAAAEA